MDDPSGHRPTSFAPTNSGLTFVHFGNRALIFSAASVQ